MTRRSAVARAPGLAALVCAAFVAAGGSTMLAPGGSARLAAGDPPIPAAEDAPVERGARLFGERCASCHFVPDPAIERDRVWIGLLHTTA